MTVTAERIRVEPAYLNIPPRVGSLGDKVVQVCASVDRILDEEQQFAADVLMSVKADGTPAALEGGVISSRQNIKTFLLEGITLTKLLEPDLPGDEGRPRLGIWSAQLFDTAQESFRNFDELFAGYPHLSRRVKKIHRGNGEEEIELHGRRRLKFKARSKSGGRGLSGDFVILDEGYALQPGHMGALLPTLSTRRRAHVLYGSSAGLADSEVLRSLRDRGRAGGPEAPAYLEWCGPGSFTESGCATRDCRHDAGLIGCALDDEDAWLRANPAMGRRIMVEFIRAERLAMPPEEFARERLGWWDDPLAGEQPISLVAWTALEKKRRQLSKAEPTFFLDVSPGMHSASIGVAAGDPVHVELDEHGAGAGWLVARAVELRDTHRGAWFAAEAAGAIGALLPELAEHGIEPELFTAQEMGRACANLQNLVAEGRLTHDGNPLFSTALAGAVKRDIGDGLWAWGRRKSSVDISPLVAVTGAAWAFAAREVQPFFAGWH